MKKAIYDIVSAHTSCRVMLLAALWWCTACGGMSAASYSVREQVEHRVVLTVEGAGGAETPWTKETKSPADTGPSLRSSAAGMAGVGAGYRLAYKHLLFHTGLTLKYAYMLNNPNDSVSCREGLIDPDNGLRYDLTETFRVRRDSIHNLQVQIPVLLGGEWGRFYFLAGAKLSAAVYSPAVRTWTYEGERQYDIFYGSVVTDRDQDPNHLPPVRYRRPLSVDLRACLEVGGRLSYRDGHNGFKSVPNPKTDWYLAAYAEYAVWTTGSFRTMEVGLRLTAQWRMDKRSACNCTNFEVL